MDPETPDAATPAAEPPPAEAPATEPAAAPPPAEAPADEPTEAASPGTPATDDVAPDEPVDAPDAEAGPDAAPSAGDEAGPVDEGTPSAPEAVDEAADAAPEAVVEVPDEPAPEGPEAFPSWLVPVGVGGIALLLLAVWWVMGRTGAPTPALDDRALPDDAEAAALPSDEAPPVAARGLAARLRERMSQSRAALQGSFDALFGRDVVDEDLLEELEETLLIADVGIATSERIVSRLRDEMKDGETSPEVLRGVLRDESLSILRAVDAPFEVPDRDGPHVIMVVGVNGSGKTTSIGKIAARLRAEGRSVLLAAGDTYRAAASEQLEVWAERAGADIVRHDEGADPGAVVYDALEAAKARGIDVVLVDTAGRLQTRRPLMEQLSKVRRVIGKKVADGPHETLLVIDGTMGQNALSQARSFHEATPLTGVVVTKLDGTAKGGMILAIASEMELPVKFIGIGEQVDDLRPFEAEAFIDALV